MPRYSQPSASRRRDHFAERVPAVRRRGVVMKRSAQIGEFDQPRQLAFLRRFDLTQAFAQFRRNEMQPERARKAPPRRDPRAAGCCFAFAACLFAFAVPSPSAGTSPHSLKLSPRASARWRICTL